MQTELWRAPYVDLDLYMGRWYEICRKPQSADDQGLRDVLVDHSRGADGSIDLLSSFDHPVLGNRTFHGVATPQDSSGSLLEISYPETLHWLPFLSGRVFVVKVDVDYRTALIGEPRRQGLVLLHRSPVMEPSEARKWLRIAECQGFDTESLVWPIHSGCQAPL